MTPACCECALPLRGYTEPFMGGVWQGIRCNGCGAHLQLRRMPSGVAVRPAGQPCAPLPVVAGPHLRGRFLAACQRVAARLVCPEGVEPGMAEAPK